MDCQAVCDDDQVRSFIRQDSVFSSPSFWIFFVLNIIAYSSFGVVTSMGDAICFALLAGEKHQRYCEDYNSIYSKVNRRTTATSVSGGVLAGGCSP